MTDRFHKYYGLRKFLHSRIGGDMQKAKPASSEAVDPPSDATGAVKMNFVPSEFDKKILIWSGKYKSESDIPPLISYGAIDNARSRIRIKMASLLMVGTLVLCGYYIYHGKKSLREGDTITKRGLERDQKMLEEYRKRKQE